MKHTTRYYEHSHICSTRLKIILTRQEHKFTNQEMRIGLSVLTTAGLREWRICRPAVKLAVVGHSATGHQTSPPPLTFPSQASEFSCPTPLCEYLHLLYPLYPDNFTSIAASMSDRPNYILMGNFTYFNDAMKLHAKHRSVML